MEYSKSQSFSNMAGELVELISTLPSCIVAFSGGVDSAVVAKAAFLALGEKALAVTGVSASLATGELEIAEQVASSIGIRHQTITTNEFEDPNYLQNNPNRCWHCKTQLYTQLHKLSEQLEFQVILNGANLDDRGDYRPGMQAASQQEVRSPLIECGIDKQAVRALANLWNLEVWDKPATPCLSSRVAYGMDVTPQRLKRIDAAEKYLRELGFNTVRVRYHKDDLARIEVHVDEVTRLAEKGLRETLVHTLQQLGFKYITVDLEGFRSGNFQQLVPSEVLEKHRS